ncbi:hypothetical protein E2C01_025554 [Portunus trituberculatus]|uniref:Uncharacterized protein n=1 Tax=Portunus trituberculatus TaxID=210409 RepID=A0A5B7EFU6_PORTR|nr:hypothetical protein [Portunus trituberculatus]
MNCTHLSQFSGTAPSEPEERSLSTLRLEVTSPRGSGCNGNTPSQGMCDVWQCGEYYSTILCCLSPQHSSHRSFCVKEPSLHKHHRKSLNLLLLLHLHHHHHYHSLTPSSSTTTTVTTYTSITTTTTTYLPCLLGRPEAVSLAAHPRSPMYLV